MSLLDNLKSRSVCIYKLYGYIDIYINLHIEEPYASYPLCTDLDFKSEYVGIGFGRERSQIGVDCWMLLFFFFQLDNVPYNLNFFNHVPSMHLFF